MLEHVIDSSWAIPLTHVTPIRSVPLSGRLSANARGVRTALPDGRGVSGVSGPTLVARQVPVSPVRTLESVGNTGRAPAVCVLRSVDVGDRGNDFPGYADAA